jgi:hypothetical protein
VRPAIECTHKAPATFKPGAELGLTLAAPQSAGTNALATVILHYRHVDQAERWKQMEMPRGDSGFAAAIAAEYTQPPFALEYYFELRDESGAAWLYPAFDAALSNQPYFTVERGDA